jgi:uncharacterized membrane protein YgcG
MGVYCVNDDYCVSGTGFPTYNDVYSQSGTYNSRDYYVGSVNGYYIFYDAGSFWCLATTLGGSPCFLQGKYPYSGLCPDLTFEYVNSSVCPTPTPTATVGCDVFNFEAKLITNIDPTPSQTYTPSPTPTLTQTPTSTNVCPNIYVDAFITGITPTTTPTPTITPSVRILRYRSNQIQCNFSGDVTFVTVDSVISCPVSKQFQDCNNGFMYYTTNIVNNPSGGDLSQFMIFRGIVDGTQRCITYIGNNSTYIGTNNISLVSGPIGYSNLGECSLCAPQLTLTPTPTITMTPSSPLITNPCLTFVNGAGFISFYDVDTNTLTSLTVPNSSSWSDIANTQTKLFLSTTNRIKEWDIVLTPFSATFVRELTNTDTTVLFGPGLFAVNNNKLVTVNTEVGLNPQYVFEINLPPLPSTSLNSSNYTPLFDLFVDRDFQGDLLITTNNKVLFTNTNSSGDWYLTQHSYTTGDFEFEILISPTITSANAIFIQNGLLYITDKNAIVYNVNLNSPYTITVITSPGVIFDGASNSLSCNNISFEFTETTYYIMKKCFDNEGPQNYIYQTQQTNIQFLNAAIYDTITESCWSYQGTTTTIPQNTVDDIVIYQGNYFTTTSSVYQTCSACLNFTPCEVPQGVQSYILINILKNSPTSPTIVISSMELDEICTTYSQVYDINNQTGNSSFQYQGIQVEEISVGTRVYKLATNPCNCVNDGNYIIYPQPSTSFDFPQTVYIITIEGCFISQITQCDGENGGITNVSGGGITFPSGGTGGSGGSGGTGGSGGSGGNGGNNPGGGPNPSSTCECTAVRTISGFQGTAFYTDCNGNPAQITVPGGTGIAGTACFCRQPNTPVTGAVTVEACQSSFGQGTINNICSSTISCS